MAGTAADAAASPPTLDSLPHALVAVILGHLVASSGGSAKWAARLGLASRRMGEAVAAAEDLWSAQCQALGWSLDWLVALPPGTCAWDYFRRRMSTRHRLRGWLRKMRAFLDPTSAAALRPGASVAQLRAAEAKLSQRLPWELYELLRWADGQDKAAFGQAVQALNGSRLLSLAEVEAAAALDRAASPRMGAAASGGDDGSSGGNTTQAVQRSPAAALVGLRLWEEDVDGSGSFGEPQQPYGPLLPFTEAVRGGRQYVMDLRGRVWLRSGFNTLPAADSLTPFVRRCLT